MVGQRTQFDMPRGQEPLDAYRTLQLMPSAPHDLIEQAYWVLVGRSRAKGSNSSRLGRLNDAYATLINPERRATYDLEHGLAKLRSRPKIEKPKRPMFSRTPKVKTRLTHYQMLDIDFDAMPEVIDTAYVYHKAQLRRSDPLTAYVRAMIEEAYETLSSPNARTKYDEKVAPRRRKPPAETAQDARVEPEAPPPAPLFPHQRVEAVLEDEAPSETAATPPPAAKPERRGVGGWLRERVGALASAAETAPDDDARAEARQKVVEAEHRRLSGLIDAGDRLPEPQKVEEAPGSAHFRFVDGPQAGETVGLANNSLILGASEAADVRLANPDGLIGAGHVRVWRRENEYILHQLDSFSTTYVNGERLDLRLAILEPGDEIRIGPHTLIFDQAPVTAAKVQAPAAT